MNDICVSYRFENIPYANDPLYLKSVPPVHPNFDKWDKWGKKNSMTVVLALWHHRPEYRIHKTGDLCCSDKHLFTAGLIFMGEDTIPRAYKPT